VKYNCEKKTNDNNKHLGKWEKSFRPTLRRMIRMTLDCIRPTQSSVIQTIHRNVGLKCFFHLPKCLFVIIVAYVYFLAHPVSAVHWRRAYVVFLAHHAGGRHIGLHYRRTNRKSSSRGKSSTSRQDYLETGSNSDRWRTVSTNRQTNRRVWLAEIRLCLSIG